MTINDWDIANANATQHNVVIGHCDVDSESEWSRGSAIPFFLANTLKVKSLRVVLVVKGENRQDIIQNRSNILSKLLDPVEMTLDKFDHKFYGILIRHNEEETSMERWHKLTLQFDCIEYGNIIEESHSNKLEIVVDNYGNIPTPMTIEITSSADIEEFALMGVCRDRYTKEDLPIVISNLTAGKTVLIDSESELITEDGQLKSADVEIWEVPSLEPGENRISLSDSNVEIKIKYRPYFM